MSDIIVPGFKSSELIAELNKSFESFSPEEKAKLLKQVCIQSRVLFHRLVAKLLHNTDHKHRRSMVSFSLQSKTRMAKKRFSLSIAKRKEKYLAVKDLSSQMLF